LGGREIGRVFLDGTKGCTSRFVLRSAITVFGFEIFFFDDFFEGM